SGTVNANGGALDGAIGNSGTFTVGGTVTSANGFTNNALGMLTINAAGHYTIGSLTNAGTVINNGTLI
ncbi:hypothetical protein, partial [Klebsiella michiganensis]|uniref:hypothetical protein n=1 Tax=Klebsiella michiganensis TaxID=1134687 RepID=UPI0013D1A14D